MRRRAFIAAGMFLASGAASQQRIPVIGFLSSRSPEESALHVAGFHAGLREAGFEQGRNVVIEHRWAGGDYQQLPVHAADLASRRVDVIAATGGNVSALAAKASTTTIPVVFLVGADPVALGLAASINKPGGNATGVSVFTTELGRKRLELLVSCVPEAATFALLTNPTYEGSRIETMAIETAAQALGKRIRVLLASTIAEIAAHLEKLAGEPVHGLLVDADALFVSRREEIVSLTARLQIPAIYDLREFAVAGGLMSYGTSLTDAYRQVGLMTAKVLAGSKPADMPVSQASKFELVLNRKTATALGLTIPPTLLARADEVIE